MSRAFNEIKSVSWFLSGGAPPFNPDAGRPASDGQWSGDRPIRGVPPHQGRRDERKSIDRVNRGAPRVRLLPASDWSGL